MQFPRREVSYSRWDGGAVGMYSRAGVAECSVVRASGPVAILFSLTNNTNDNNNRSHSNIYTPL